MIRAERLLLRAGARVLLSDASFEIERGQFVAVLGPNGVGKTTLLRTIAGVRAPDGGHVTIEGAPVQSMQAHERARAMAHIAGDDLFIDRLTVRDVVSMGRYAHHRWWQWREEARDDAAIAHALRAVHMESFTERRFDTLSSGERQRIWLAMALAQEARILLLDEPTSHLDVRVAREMLQLLRAQSIAGKTILCVLHDVNEALEFADRILLLRYGAPPALDTPDRIAASSLLEETYGIALETLRTPSGSLRVYPRATRDLVVGELQGREDRKS
jgi:iron complex transport system ATP-binding protein